MRTLAQLIDTHGVDVLEHLDRQVTVPVVTGLQRQGDVIVVPDATARAKTPVPAGGVAVVKGEASGNTHALVSDRESGVRCDVRTATVRDLTLASLVVPEGAVAFLAHPEHGFSGIGPGNYTLRRQREQADEIRILAD